MADFFERVIFLSMCIVQFPIFESPPVPHQPWTAVMKVLSEAKLPSCISAYVALCQLYLCNLTHEISPMGSIKEGINLDDVKARLELPITHVGDRSADKFKWSFSSLF